MQSDELPLVVIEKNAGLRQSCTGFAFYCHLHTLEGSTPVELNDAMCVM